MLLTSVGAVFSADYFNKNKIIVQFQCTSDYNSTFTYCDKIKTLYDDWMDNADNCPENDASLLWVTFYHNNEAFPITKIGLNTNITFESMMIEIEKIFKDNVVIKKIV